MCNERIDKPDYIWLIYPFVVYFIVRLFSKRIFAFKRKLIKVDWNGLRDSCGSSGTGETHAAFTPRRLTARPAESEHLKRKSTTLHYLVNSNKVCEKSL
jgi:hypothetical protein